MADNEPSTELSAAALQTIIEGIAEKLRQDSHAVGTSASASSGSNGEESQDPGPSRPTPTSKDGKSAGLVSSSGGPLGSCVPLHPLGCESLWKQQFESKLASQSSVAGGLRPDTLTVRIVQGPRVARPRTSRTKESARSISSGPAGNSSTVQQPL